MIVKCVVKAMFYLFTLYRMHELIELVLKKERSLCGSGKEAENGCLVVSFEVFFL